MTAIPRVVFLAVRGAKGSFTAGPNSASSKLVGARWLPFGLLIVAGLAVIAAGLGALASNRIEPKARVTAGTPVTPAAIRFTEIYSEYTASTSGVRTTGGGGTVCELGNSSGVQARRGPAVCLRMVR